MKLSISNIAWDIEIEEEVFYTLKNNSIYNIDISLSKYFNNINLISDNDIASLKSYFSSNSIEVIGMQSLLFGLDKLNIYKSSEDREFLLNHLTKTCIVAEKLNIKKLVFGSARNRNYCNKGSFSDNIAFDFFYKLALIGKKYNLFICLEPQPKIYNSNFLTDSSETADFVRLIGNNNFKMQLDIGSMIVNKESPELIIKYSDLYGHIHLSEPYLKPIDRNNEKHYQFSKIITNNLTSDFITIEMLTKGVSEPINKIESSIKVAKDFYNL